MIIQSVFDAAFRKYGQVVSGYDFSELLDTMRGVSPKPLDGVVYVPGCAEMEGLAVRAELSDRYYGGMPIQIGYCNGFNTKLNCLEYHRDSEVDIAADDVILLLGRQEDVNPDGFTYDTEKVEAFLLPAGAAVELYGTTLHYAPCAALKSGFRVVIVLPQGTNTYKPAFTPKCDEDKLMTARNKWLIAHAESTEAGEGAHVGLIGANLDVCGMVK